MRVRRFLAHPELAKPIFRLETAAMTGQGFDASRIPPPSLAPPRLLRRSTEVLGALPDP